MKKRLIFTLAMLIGVNALIAQTPGKKITEGKVVYAVEWQLPEQMKPMAANFPTELIVLFKGDSTSLKTESSMYTSISILNTKKEYERLLLDVPMMGKKLSVIFTPADQEKMQDKLPELTFKESTESKVLAGYKAQKYLVSETKSKQNFEAWFTKDIEIIPNTLTRYYDKSYGFPLEFSSFMNGITIKAKVKEITPGPVPLGSFSATPDFEEITLDQLMQISGGR